MVLKQQVMLILFWGNLWLSDHWVHYINSYMAAASTRVNRSHISLSTVGQAPCEGFSTNWQTFTQIDDRSLEFSVYMCPNDLKMFIMSPSCAFNMQCICLPWRNLFTFCSSVKFFFISSWWIPMRCKHKPPFISNWRISMPHFIEYNFFLLY